MLRSMLVGLDGSEYSQAALRFALPWARRTNALVVGLGVIDEPDIRENTSTPMGMDYLKEKRDQQVLQQTRKQVDRILEEFTLVCTREQAPHKLLEEVGLPDEEILQEAQRYDLIVLGERTFFKTLDREAPDDTLTRVLKACPRPVLRVPLQPQGGSDILVAYDGSLQAARTLQMFQLLLLQPTDVVHVLAVSHHQDEASRHADRAAEFLGDRQGKTVTHPVATQQSVAEVLLEKAHALDAGLLVMGAFGHGNLREFFFGSVTKTLLEQSRFPLFLYH